MNVEGNLKPLVKVCACGAKVEVSNEFTPGICKKCIDERQKEIEEINQRELIAQQQRQAAELKRKAAMVPKRYHNLESDRKDILAQVTDYKSFFIWGSTGTGKTVLAASIAKKHDNVRWESYPALIMKLQSMYRSEKDAPHEYAVEVARFNGLLVLDDIGAEKLTEFVRQTTYFILNEREQNLLPIVITSNYSLIEIDKLIDSRVSSRIGGICEVVKLSGRDLRLE